MSNKVPRLLPLVLAVAGLFVSGVLEWIHAKTYLMPSVDSFCKVNESFDCSTVALSRMSVLLGVPLPLWGGAGFLAMTIAAWQRSKLLWPLAAFAALASIGLLAESLLHVGSVCLMCEAVHLLSVLLAIVAFRSHRRHGEAISGSSIFTALAVPATIVLATALLIPPYWAPLTWQRDVPHPTGITEDGHHWVGAENPTITIEEFVDYGCPHCAIATNRTRRRLATDGDRLRVIRRHQPRMRCNERNHGCLSVRAAHCAHEQGKFWEMDAWLFANRPGRADLDVLEGAKALELDEPSFMICLEDPQTYEWADAEAAAARKLKIKVTPTYRVDGKKVMPVDLEVMLDAKL